MGDEFRHSIRVRFNECDPQGHVFNANYLAYFDVCLTEMWREAIGGWQAMVERGIDAVVGEATIRFRSPARNDDLLDLRMSVANLGTTSITTEVEIVRDGETLVEGTLRHVCVDAKTLQKTPIPDWLRDGLAPYATK